MKIMVTAVGSMSAPAVIASLKLAGHTIIGCDIYPRSWVSASCNTERFYQAPRVTDEEGYLQFLLQCSEREQLDMILPLTDPEVDLLSSRRDRFPPEITLAIPAHETVLLARDKLRWYQAFCHHEYVRPVPSCSLDQYQPDSWNYPLFMKPRNGRSSEGTQRISNARELALWQEVLAGQRCIVQPLLKGTVYVIDIVRHAQTRQCVSVARQELIRTANGAGLTVKMSNQSQLTDLAHCVADTLSLNGCINIELLCTEEDSYLMDINPRFSAGVEFSQMAGYDMVLNHLRCFSSTPLSPAIAIQPQIFTRHYVATEGIAGEMHE